MKYNVTFGKYYSDEHNILMQHLINNINGVIVVGETKSESDEVVYEVEIKDEKMKDVLSQLADCDIIYFDEVK